MENINTQNNENENVVKKTKKEQAIFISKIVGNIVFYAVIIFLFLFSLMNINAGSDGKGFPNIFGRGFLSVQTSSMERNDIESDDVDGWNDYEIGEINTGDLVNVKVFKKDDCSTLKVGDVITFYDNKLGALNTHRIVYINESGKSVICQGDKSAEYTPFDTKDPFGTYNGQLDLQGDIQTVSVENIKGIVTSVNEGAGKTLDNIQKNWLFIFVIPVLVFLLFEIFLVVKNIMDLKGAKQKAEIANDKDTMMAELEAQKEAMRQQILAELAQQQAQAAPAVEADDVSQDKEETVEVVEEVAEVSNEEVQPEEVTVEEKEPEEDKE